MRKTLMVLIMIFGYFHVNISFGQTKSLPSNYLDSLPIRIEKVIKDFENALIEEENKMPPLYDEIQSVKKNLEILKKLIRTELQNAEGYHIDYVPQYELGQKVEIEPWAYDSIERYQISVRNFLSKGGYDLIGWEATALDTVTRQAYEHEILNKWKEADPNININPSNLFVRFTSEYMWQDGVLAHWVMNPNAKLIGLQEIRLWKLNIEANTYDIPFGYYVSEFRSYVAMAKMIKAIKGNKSKQHIRAVIVMGAWHETDVTMIAKSLRIKMNVINVSID